jgi:polar amino acid transport system ATP-binding protein
MTIELKSITHSFGAKNVLNNITYSDDLSSLSVIGPSGGGKSTLLRIIGGLLVPVGGELYLDGKKIEFDENFLIEYRRSIGFVFQSNGLFEHLNALENITLPLIKAFGYNKADAQATALRLLARFSLEQDKNKYPSQLSGGQQQRIAIARAVAVNPKLLLLDEPTSALDPELTSDVLDMLGELQSENLRTIIVTHEMGFAAKACDKVLFMADGKIIESGKSADLFKAPASDKLKAFLNKVLAWDM